MIIVKGDIAARGDFLKHQVGDIGPACKGSTRQRLTSGSKSHQIISDDIVGAYIPTATAIAPEADGQEISDFIKRIGRRYEFNDGKLIAAHESLIPGAGIEEVSPGFGRNPIQARIAQDAISDIVILRDQAPAGVTQIKIRVFQRAIPINCNTIQRDLVSRARNQIHRIPIMIAIHLKHAGDRCA